MKKSIHDSKAFTLIELLVVIAIIAILASILFPVFAQARAKAQQTVCASNMGQIGRAIMLYLNDTNGVWVPYGAAVPIVGYDTRGQNLPAVTITKGKIDPYLKNYKVTQCPSRPKTYAQSIMAFNGFCPPVGGMPNTAGGNAYWGGDQRSMKEYGPFTKSYITSGSSSFLIAAKDVDFEDIASTVIYWEHLNAGIICYVIQQHSWYDKAPNDATFNAHYKWIHHDGANMLWADGHVKRYLMSQLKRPQFSVIKSIYPR